MSLLSHSLADSVGEEMGEREEVLLVTLVGGVAEHEALVSGAEVFDVLVLVDRVGDLSSLSFNLKEHVAVVAVEADFSRGVADLFADSSGNGFVVNLLFASDFSEKSNLCS